MRAGLALAAALLVVAMAPGAEAQIKSCGELDLFIRNPDIQPQGDGKFHVAGDFFMQFQVIGDGADAIETFAFSVGLPVDNPEEICTLPIWPGGLMLEAYKADENKADGFFILMNTAGQSTPQQTDLSVAVHGYDAAGTEIARFWGTAVVESCTSTAPLGGCPSSEVDTNDVLMPWPIILPGDGAESLVDGFTVEFAEPLSEVAILLNNEDITDEMQVWDGRVWDRDVFWDYGPGGLVGVAVPMCTLDGTQIQSCGPADGPAYEWTQRRMSADDVIRVVATDMAGNVATKEIHIGSSVASGAIDDGIPILQMTAEEPTLTVAPGEAAIFKMRLENTGSGEGHPFATATVPEGWAYEWVPGHKPVPAGGTSEQELHVTPPADATDGSHTIEALVEYRQGSDDKVLRSVLTATVVVPEGFQAPEPDAGESKGSPTVGLLALLVGLAFVAVRRSTP